jgi:aspartate kinase
VREELAKGKIVVIAGFQGVSRNKEVTTLGRGGSDTTAVAMAAALDAEYCEICSDVDGVYSADPRVVGGARRIGTLSYEETQEMAEAGAKVLNAQAVEFAKDKGIAIYARATSGPLPGPDPSSDGTVVRRSPLRAPGAVVGVASERDIVLLNADVPAADLLALLDERGVGGKQLHISGDRTQIAVSRQNLHDEAHLKEALEARFTGRARLVDGLAAVSVVGAGINATHANVLAGTDALAQAGITPAGTATSSFRITWMIPRERTDDAVRALHQRFIESSETALP